LQLGPDVPQVLDNLTHLLRWKLPGVSISDQCFCRFCLELKHPSSASFNRHPSAKPLRMDQFLKHRSSGGVRWQEDRFSVESQPPCPSCLEIPLGVHALIHHTTGSPEVSGHGLDFGLSQTCSSIPT